MTRYKKERDSILLWFDEQMQNESEEEYYSRWEDMSHITWDNFYGFDMFTVAVIAAATIQTLKYTKHSEYENIFGSYVEIMSIPDERGFDRIPMLDPIEIIRRGLHEIEGSLYIPRKCDVYGFYDTLKAVYDRRKEVDEWFNPHWDDED